MLLNMKKLLYRLRFFIQIYLGSRNIFDIVCSFINIILQNDKLLSIFMQAAEVKTYFYLSFHSNYTFLILSKI